LTYWLNEPYLGFGAGAHSSWKGERYENVKNPRVYMQRTANHRSPVENRERISSGMQMAETVFLGLRLAEGVSWARFRERFGEDARDVFRQPIELLSSWQVLKTDGEGMRLTERGMLISNQLLWRFLPDE
jgi:oxygen-independent coproporphyrinogen-3 oxidase